MLLNSLRRMQGGDGGVSNLNSMGHGQDGGNAGGLSMGMLNGGGGGGGSSYGLPMQFGGQLQQYNQQALLQGMTGGAG